MSIVIESGDLKTALETVKGFIPKSPVLRILANFRLKTSGNQMTIQAFDLETSIETKLQIENESGETLDICVPLDATYKLLKSLPAQPIALCLNRENYILTIETHLGNVSIAASNGLVFPTIPNKFLFETSADVKELKTICALHSKTAGKYRDIFNNIFVIQKNSQRIVYASDTNLLVTEKFKTTDSKEFTWALRASFWKKLGIVLGKTKQETTNISYTDKNILIEFGNTRITGRFTNIYKIPDFEQYSIQPEPNVVIIANAKELKSRLILAVMYADGKNSYETSFSLSKKNELLIESNSPEFCTSAKQRLTTLIDSDYDFKLYFNAESMLAIVRKIKGDVLISFNTSDDKIYIQDAARKFEPTILIRITPKDTEPMPEPIPTNPLEIVIPELPEPEPEPEPETNEPEIKTVSYLQVTQESEKDYYGDENEDIWTDLGASEFVPIEKETRCFASELSALVKIKTIISKLEITLQDDEPVFADFAPETEPFVMTNEIAREITGIPDFDLADVKPLYDGKECTIIYPAERLRAATDLKIYTSPICVWVQGATEQYEADLKELGFRFAARRGEWYVSLDKFHLKQLLLTT